MFHARPKPMIRILACTALACLAASCVPPKAILVEAAPEPKPTGNKPTKPQEVVAQAPQIAQGNKGMRVRNVEETLPEAKDFTPTAATVGNAGAVIASPGGTKPSVAPKEEKEKKPANE